MVNMITTDSIAHVKRMNKYILFYFLLTRQSGQMFSHVDKQYTRRDQVTVEYRLNISTPILVYILKSYV